MCCHGAKRMRDCYRPELVLRYRDCMQMVLVSHGFVKMPWHLPGLGMGPQCLFQGKAGIKPHLWCENMEVISVKDSSGSFLPLICVSWVFTQDGTQELELSSFYHFSAHTQGCSHGMHPSLTGRTCINALIQQRDLCEQTWVPHRAPLPGPGFWLKSGPRYVHKWVCSPRLHSVAFIWEV